MKANTMMMALGALAMGARAQDAVAPDVQQSVLMVLAQAIPSDSLAYALASSSAFAAEMASSLSAGNTPTWYQALPTDVQSLLPQIYPAAVQATPTPTPTPSSSAYVVKSSSAVESSSAKITPYPTGMNSTMVKPTMSATGGASISVTLSPSDTASSTPPPPFEGAASRLSVGAGLGAALVLGMLAL
ncbi:hypothetical protein AA0113_g6270 [Alternaria arborescens]|uniref:FAS1 domain-containing protein n=1 Tax=Alternaria arborescens TaxID=156630 RepID=A0A4Q4S0I7_9PLEO|nr:hypothetical protein AA0111_g8061 [Alternaria arborescens]RYN28431.1 hypothetical protein AA0112_g7555 [Alternaria arborescens]RYO26601.1 hypothetical protein AA0111_g8061 [Alternaria arborescens]RYO63267.1 hypothetical protein AA0113_g6270 [Alternaria arborescens]